MVELPVDIAKTVEPFPIPEVKGQHLPTIFADFRAVLHARIEELKMCAVQTPRLKLIIQFDEFLLDDVDVEKFSKMQRKFLNSCNLDFDKIRGYVKYMDPIIWHESKLHACLRYGLVNIAPIRILDIGTGPGHFQVVCRFLGHEVVGTELPNHLDESRTETHSLFYNALADIYRLKRVPCHIEPNMPLPDLGRGYDMVTAFMAAFSFDRKKGRPWELEEWRFFLRDLKANVLKGSGSAIFTLAHGRTSTTVWEFLAEHAVDSDPRALRLRFENFDWLD